MIRSAAHATALTRRLLKVEGVPINQQRDWSKWVRPVVRTGPSECASTSCARRRTVRCVQESQEKDDVKWNDQVRTN